MLASLKVTQSTVATQRRIDEGFRPAQGGFVPCDSYRPFLFPFHEDAEEELHSAFVQFSEVIDAAQFNTVTADDGYGGGFFSGFQERVHKPHDQGALDALVFSAAAVPRLLIVAGLMFGLASESFRYLSPGTIADCTGWTDERRSLTLHATKGVRRGLLGIGVVLSMPRRARSGGSAGSARHGAWRTCDPANYSEGTFHSGLHLLPSMSSIKFSCDRQLPSPLLHACVPRRPGRSPLPRSCPGRHSSVDP